VNKHRSVPHSWWCGIGSTLYHLLARSSRILSSRVPVINSRRPAAAASPLPSSSLPAPLSLVFSREIEQEHCISSKTGRNTVTLVWTSPRENPDGEPGINLLPTMNSFNQPLSQFQANCAANAYQNSGGSAAATASALYQQSQQQSGTSVSVSTNS